MRDRKEEQTRATNAAQLARLNDINIQSAGGIMSIGEQIGQSGEQVLGMLRAFQDPNVQAQLGQIVGTNKAQLLGDMMKSGGPFMDVLSAMSLGPDSKRIAEALGEFGDTFRLLPLAGAMGPRIDLEAAESGLLQQNFSSEHRGWLAEAANFIMGLFGMDPRRTELSREQVELLRQLVDKGPGV